MADTSSVGAALSDSFSWPAEPFEVAPHPCNLAFLQVLSAQVIKTFGTHLHLIASGEDFQWAACLVRDFFSAAFGAGLGLPATPGLIRHPPTARKSIEPAFDVLKFANLMKLIPEPLLDVQCAVVRNLEWLKTALHLQPIETKLLLWTYAISHRRSKNLRDAFGAVRFNPESDAHAAMAVLLDEPVDAAARYFAAPDRLRAMRQSWKGRCVAPFGLDECFAAGELLPAVLETVHRSPEAMLQRLLEPERHWTLDPEVRTPSSLYYEWLERPVADAFVATLLHRPLTNDHIVALVEWLTGLRFEAAQCTVLAGT
jgi:hypothetical protein